MREWKKYFRRKKLYITGNPVRSDILKPVDRAEAMKYFGLDVRKKTILIMGGSLGARTLNQSIEASIDLIKKSDAQVLWQTGKLYFDSFKPVADNVPNIKVLQFIDRMDYAYACADIVITRAGALSIAELELLGKPVILVPSPNVTEDHQTFNAMALVNHNAGLMIKDNESKQKLFPAALKLLKDENKMQELSLNIGKLGIANAADRITDEILKVAKPV